MHSSRDGLRNAYWELRAPNAGRSSYSHIGEENRPLAASRRAFWRYSGVRRQEMEEAGRSDGVMVRGLPLLMARCGVHTAI